MTRHADERSAYIIYPEGRLFTPAVHERSMARLAGKDPERAERLAKLDRMLPPRPGGLFTLLDAVPAADLVVVGTHGVHSLVGDPLQHVSRFLILAAPCPVLAVPGQETPT